MYGFISVAIVRITIWVSVCDLRWDIFWHIWQLVSEEETCLTNNNFDLKSSLVSSDLISGMISLFFCTLILILFSLQIEQSRTFLWTKKRSLFRSTSTEDALSHGIILKSTSSKLFDVISRFPLWLPIIFLSSRSSWLDFVKECSGWSAMPQSTQTELDVVVIVSPDPGLCG